MIGPLERMRARAVLFFVLAIYTATFTGIPDNPDGEIAYQTTRSLALDGELAIHGTSEAETILAFARSAPPGAASVRPGAGERSDRYYAWFGVGQALAGVPFFWVGRILARASFSALDHDHEAVTSYGLARTEYVEHLAVGWRNPLLAALTVWLVVSVATRLGARRAEALAGGLALGLGTYLWPQARSSLSDVQATFLLFLAFHWLLVARESLERSGRVSALVLLGIGSALGGAFLTRIAVGGAALALLTAAIVVLARASPAREHVRASRMLSLLLLPVVCAALVWTGTNWVRFGDVLESGYGEALARMGLFSRSPWPGLAGLLVSPGRGLLWMAPGILLAPVGIAWAWRRGERLWPLMTIAVSLAVLAPAALAPGWHGAWTYGPRYLLPLLPFAWVGVVLASTATAGRRAWRLAASALFLAGLLVAIPGVLVDTMSYHDLAVRAARIAWPDEPGSEGDADAARFERMQWDRGFAAPLAHARILGRRLAGRGEEHPVAEIFLVDSPARLHPSNGRDEGFRHLAWIDLHERLRRSVFWPAAWVGSLLLLALVEALRRPSSPRGDGSR
jgi:hypothetical protein